MRCFNVLAALPLILATPAQADPRAAWGKASDVGRTGVAVVAFSLPAIDGDWRGAKQSLLAMGTTSLVTGALKYSIRERRPDGSNDHSFPSGHTSLSFAAAASIGQRVGWKAGVPAHLVAGFVGLARVKANKHYWHDVAVGAVIGEVAGRLLVDRRRGRRGAAPLVMTMRVAF